MTSNRNILSEASDDELLVRYKSTGDLHILSFLYQRYMDLAFAVAFKYLKESDSAKDAVMDVFEELVDKLRKHEVNNFRSWLHTLVKNHCLMKLRSTSKVKVISMEENGMQSHDNLHQEDVFEKELQLDQMSDCIEKLSQEQRIAIRLFYLEEKCYNDISAVMGMEWNKVRSLIQNGRRNLKICMERKVTSSTTK